MQKVNEMSLATKKARARHFAKGDSRKPGLAIVQRLNHLSTPKNSNRCMVNKTKKRKPQSDVMKR